MREYADPVIDWLDQGRGLIEGRLFRESCTNIKGSYVKDLTVVERDLSKVCLVDNSPISYGLHQGILRLSVFCYICFLSSPQVRSVSECCQHRELIPLLCSSDAHLHPYDLHTKTKKTWS